jgi:error-prone DNA polymerase
LLDFDLLHRCDGSSHASTGTGSANVVVWSSLFERQRRIVLSASMVGCRGRVQREGDGIHLVAEQLEDLAPLLRGVRNRADVSLSQPATEKNEACHNVPDRVEPARTLRLATRSFR